ncbi:MAG: peptidylprolyl isomerase [Flavobacteriaceae bacterium]|nr:peptidylprolyl isomerase [Flavobacteriaceae bacterium]
MFKIKYLFLIFFVAQLSCQDKQTLQKKAVKNTNAPEKKTVLNKEFKPIISQKTVVSFLTQYASKHKENNVLIKTRLGDIHIQLFNETPLHRANFLLLTKEGYFNTSCFHRVVKDFIIQAGQSDKNSTRELRKKIGTYKIPPEFTKHKHHKGALSSARRWNENPKKLSDPYEFFIVHKKMGLHHLDNEHTVFGKVIKGLDVVDKIAQEAIDKGEWPIKDINLIVNIY